MFGREIKFHKVVFGKVQMFYVGEKLQTTNKIIIVFTAVKTSDDELYRTPVYHHEKLR